jgi:outer membrane immunogenic protein
MKRVLLATTALALSGPAFAADLPVRMPLKGPAYVARPVSWTGCYVGGHLGADWGHANFIDPNTFFNDFFFPAGNGLGLFAPTGAGVGINQGTGLVAGGQIGCDYQFAANWVVGLAGDFSWTSLDGNRADPFAFTGGDPFFAGKNGVPATLRDHTEWLASVTGRIGYAWDRWMLYGKGGVAWEHSRDIIEPLTIWGTSAGAVCATGTPSAPCVASGADTDTGWTVGVGLEWAFARNWTAGIEYDHYGFGSHTVTLTAPPAFAGGTGGSAPITVNQSIEAVKVTLDYHFGWFGQ